MFDKILALCLIGFLAVVIAAGAIQQVGHPVAIAILVAVMAIVAFKILVAGSDED